MKSVAKTKVKFSSLPGMRDAEACYEDLFWKKSDEEDEQDANQDYLIKLSKQSFETFERARGA